MDADAQTVAGGVVTASALVGFLMWAVRRMIEGSEKRIDALAATLKDTGDRMVASVDKLTDQLQTLTSEVTEVKVHARVTADRIEAIAYATGEITPTPVEVPLRDDAPNGRRRRGGS